MAHERSRSTRFRMIAVWGVSIIAVLAGVLFAVAAFVLTRPFPDYRGRVEVAGITAPVEILRDGYGVPHIYAETLNDLAFGQGYAHAQDRFWQMEFWRRIGAGRLAEILGEDLIETDRYLRTMGFARVAEIEYRELPPSVREWLQSYAAGVNAYTASRPPGKLGLEFAILGLNGVRWDVEPWHPVDTLTWAKIMAQDLSNNLGTEIANLGAIVGGGRPLARLISPPYPASHPVIVSSDELKSFRRQLGIEVASEDGPVASYRATRGGVGSNSWVIAPELTAGEGALLANDMHLSVQMPSIWYEVGLHLVDGTHSLRGYSFPGVPGIVAGQNDTIAWGITNLGGDVQDLFLEDIDPENRDRYRDGGEWREMERRVEKIYVSGRDRPVKHVVRRTSRGPVISDLSGYTSWTNVRLDSDRPPGIERASATALSIGWPALEPGTIIRSIFALNQASDYEGFRDALRLWDVPGQNFVYADSAGNIAYQATGAHPIRTDHIGQLPARAGIGERWSGRVAFDQLPGAFNPDKGYIVTANNPVIAPGLGPFLGIDFANGYRARRIVELIEASDDPIDPDRIAEIQGDVVSLFAIDALPYLNSISVDEAVDAWDASWVDVDNPVERDTQRERALISAAITSLDDWNAELTTDSPEAVVFGYVWMKLIEAVLSDEFPPWAWPPISIRESQTIIVDLLPQREHPAWDDRLTPTIESRDEILARAIASGAIAAGDAMGDDPKKWRWGDLHQVHFRNESLGRSGIALIEALFNRGPFPAPGGATTVNVSIWETAVPFQPTVIASQRAIYDLGDPSKSRFIHPTGQSGHPFHRHYDDFIEPWLEIEYHPANWRREDVEADAGRRRIELRPR